MKPYFHKAEHFTPNPDYDIDISVSHISSLPGPTRDADTRRS